jgi:acetyltransferase AlgX (SGNH hydrolase-like protein)
LSALLAPDAAVEVAGSGDDLVPVAREATLGRWLDRLVALGFVLALAVPGVLFAAGTRPVSIENREQATLPSLSWSALTDPAFYAAIDKYLVDNLPLRNEAIEAHAEVGQQILGGPVDPKVVRGAGNWLFLRGEMQPDCTFTAVQVLDQVDRVAAGLAATGRSLRYVVAPDKHGIYPERVVPEPGIPPPCSDAQRSTLQAGLAARPAAAVDFWTPTLAERSKRPTAPLYYIQDEHWTPLGSVPAIKALVQSLDPRVWRDSDVTIAGTEAHTADMSRLIGLPHDEIIPKVVMRPGIKVSKKLLDTGVHVEHARDIPWFTVTGTSRVVPGRTLFIYDSFFGTVMTRVSPFFEESVWVHEGDLYNHPELAAALPQFDTVVFERVERSAYFTNVASVLASVIARPGR